MKYLERAAHRQRPGIYFQASVYTYLYSGVCDLVAFHGDSWFCKRNGVDQPISLSDNTGFLLVLVSPPLGIQIAKKSPA